MMMSGVNEGHQAEQTKETHISRNKVIHLQTARRNKRHCRERHLQNMFFTEDFNFTPLPISYDFSKLFTAD